MPDEGVHPTEELTRTEVLARLQPGGVTELGFLGPHESLDEVIAGDTKTMERLGLSYDRLADALDKLLKRAFEMYFDPVPIANLNVLPPPEPDLPNLRAPETMPHFDLGNLPHIKWGFLIDYLQVFLVVYKSWVDCPWGDNAFGRSDFMIVNRNTGESVTGHQLLPHLIRSHHFFGGLGSPYRSDPDRLANVLGLVTDPDHQ